MVPASRFAVTICALIIGGYLSWCFHECVHWAAGRLFSGDPSVLYGFWYKIPYPYAVEFNGLSKMPNWGVRIAGISPHIIWTMLSVYSISNSSFLISTDVLLMAESLHSIPFLSLVIISAAFGAGVSVSPSDVVAAIYPSKYRKFAGEDLSHREWFRVLVGRVS
jgi:hypothetical protein